MSYYVDEQGRAIAEKDIQAILDSKRKRIAELERELALLQRQRVYDLDCCVDAYKLTLKRLAAANAEKSSMDEMLETFQDSAKRYGELRKKLVETKQRYKAVCEGIMMSIDSSWRPNEARDWGRPELILGEYVGDLRNELAAEKAARETAETKKHNAQSQLASATDFANIWARESGVLEAYDERDLKDVIDRIWSKASGQRTKAETDRDFWKERSELMQSQRDTRFAEANQARTECDEAQTRSLGAVRQLRVAADNLLAVIMERDELAAAWRASVPVGNIPAPWEDNIKSILAARDAALIAEKDKRIAELVEELGAMELRARSAEAIAGIALHKCPTCKGMRFVTEQLKVNINQALGAVDSFHDAPCPDCAGGDDMDETDARDCGDK